MYRAIGSGVLVAALLAGCAGVSSTDGGLEGGPSGPPIDPIQFVGKPPSELEKIVGAPALVRAEGLGEFRRYDGPDCSVYALVKKSGASPETVASVTAGARFAGADRPETGVCLRAVADAAS